MARFVGTKVEFGADTDEFTLNVDARELPLIHSDTYLNDLLLKSCEEALAAREVIRASCARELSTRSRRCFLMEECSWKTLLAVWNEREDACTKASEEGLNFTEILQHMRRDLAVRYLDDRNLHVSKIAWLLGFYDVSAFTHAFKRWTGKTPRQMRTAGAY